MILHDKTNVRFVTTNNLKPYSALGCRANTSTHRTKIFTYEIYPEADLLSGRRRESILQHQNWLFVHNTFAAVNCIICEKTLVGGSVARWRRCGGWRIIAFNSCVLECLRFVCMCAAAAAAITAAVQTYIDGVSQ